jgi:hypothetical protein
MPRRPPQFTPRQLLDAGRRAEAEGKIDLAHQFYGHLSHHYGHTAEAVEGRQALARIGIAGQYPHVWQNGEMAPADGVWLSAASIGRAGHATHLRHYRLGRALAALVSCIGWVLVGLALLAIASGLTAELAQIVALQDAGFGSSMLSQAVGALFIGALLLLLGEAARALFDQAAAARELLAIQRTKAQDEDR